MGRKVVDRMNNASVRPADEIEAILNRYGDMLYRLCLLMLKSESDAEDAVQETLIRYLRKAPAFADGAHEKAWLIKVASNQCRDLLRYRARHPLLDDEALAQISCTPDGDSGILEALTALPEKHRLVLSLYYIEQYRVEDIAKIIGKTPSAVKMRLQKGRRALEKIYREEYL